MKSKKNFQWVIVFLLIAGSFFLLDMQSVPLGDDLGYMFTDSAHHLGDGHRVRILSDISETLSSHYLTTNGRYLVHWIAMFFLNFGGKVWFCLANSVVFFFTAYFFTLLSINRRRVTSISLLLMTIVLWFSVPEPGVTWISLVCYSTNYLWPALATLAFLYLIVLYRAEGAGRKHGTRGLTPGSAASGRAPWRLTLSTLMMLYCVLSLLSGALQESFSLPVSCGLFVWLLVNRKNLKPISVWMTVAYWLGTALCFFAPGNLHHAAQGGGFAPDALLAKSAALLEALVFRAPVISVTLFALLLGLMFDRKRLGRFLRENLLISVSILAALLLASVSFTSSRQLTCPALLCGVLLVRYGVQNYRLHLLTENARTLLGIFIVLFYVGGVSGAYILRSVTAERYRSLHSQASEGKKVLIYDLVSGEERKRLWRWLGYFDFDRIPVIFDGYTKRGLSRLYTVDEAQDKVTTVLPCETNFLLQCAKESKMGDDFVETAPLVGRYSCFLIPGGRTVRHLRDSLDRPVPFERVSLEGQVLVVVPSNRFTTRMKFGAK